ncbi:MAG: aldolase/citrate lyase family protein [bacterium]
MAKRRTLKTKFRKRLPVFAGWTSLGHPSISEIIARSGIDFIGIDIEHSTISQEQSQRIVAASQASGILCLPRVASHNIEMIKRLLDSGADGIIIPMVQQVDEVQRIISGLKFPPEGRRSYGISRAQGYGFDFDEYAAEWNDSSSLIVQIESIEGVEHIDSILKIKQVDGVMIGPYDLSGSLNIPGKLDHAEVQNACKKVIDSCKKHNKSCGNQLIEPDSAGIQKALADGYTCIVLSSDIFLLWKWSQRMKHLIKNVREGIER